VEGLQSIKTQELAITNQAPGQLALYGAGGLLSGDGGLTFRDGTLVTPKLGGFTAAGEMDFAKQGELTDPSATIDQICTITNWCLSLSALGS
jgi:hypothetical protein